MIKPTTMTNNQVTLALIMIPQLIPDILPASLVHGEPLLWTRIVPAMRGKKRPTKMRNIRRNITNASESCFLVKHYEF
jgi:hypothetical protein